MHLHSPGFFTFSRRLLSPKRIREDPRAIHGLAKKRRVVKSKSTKDSRLSTFQLKKKKKKKEAISKEDISLKERKKKR
jgi:hypothetical protein